MENPQREHELTQLCEAYHEVVVEARQVMALQRRMEFLLGAARQDMRKLEAAMHRVQDLEQTFTQPVPPEGAA